MRSRGACETWHIAKKRTDQPDVRCDVRNGDELTVLPQEICPVDRVVLDGHGIMNEA